MGGATIKKLGPHLINETPQAMAWARHAPIVKELTHTGALRAARPGAIKIFRRYFTEFEQEDLVDYKGKFGAVMEQLGDFRDPNLYAEIYNEKYQFMGTGLPVYCDFLEKIIPLFHAEGIKVCGPAWSTGAYDIHEWVYMRSRNWVGLDAILVHGYWANFGFTIWNALRWTQYWEPGDPPVINTEAGRDAVRDMPGGGMSGWGGWKADGLTKEQFLTELEAYDAELQKRPECLGAVVFTAGATTDWQNYNTDDLDIPEDLSWEGGTSPEPPNNGGNEMPSKPEFLQGFKDYADAHPEVGEPLTRMFYDDYVGYDGVPVTVGRQFTTRGEMRWYKDTGVVEFIPKG